MLASQPLRPLPEEHSGDCQPPTMDPLSVAAGVPILLGLATELVKISKTYESYAQDEQLSDLIFEMNMVADVLERREVSQ